MAESFEDIVSTEFNFFAEDVADDSETVYTLRIMYMTCTGERITVLMPWLTYSETKAHEMEHHLTTTSIGHALVPPMLYKNKPDACKHAVPIGVAVVALTQIPF